MKHGKLFNLFCFVLGPALQWQDKDYGLSPDSWLGQVGTIGGFPPNFFLQFVLAPAGCSRTMVKIKRCYIVDLMFVCAVMHLSVHLCVCVCVCVVCMKNYKFL